MINSKFNDYDIVTDGKFVYVAVEGNYGTEEKFFGIYNHKYFSFIPNYPVGCIGSVAKAEDFRRATKEEVETFLSDCKNLGYEYDNKTHRFVDYKFGQKDGFLTMKMPHYVPFNSFKNRTVIAQFNYSGTMYWIFSDKTYTRLLLNYHDIEDRDSLKVYSYEEYDDEDKWDGEELINSWDGNRYFAHMRDDRPVTHPRTAWWYFVSHCLNFNFYRCTDINELYKVFDEKNFTELGKNFIECGLIDIEDMKALAVEFFNNQVFKDLVAAISQKQKMQEEIEKKMNEINRFDI